jgi:hypothetical protein
MPSPTLAFECANRCLGWGEPDGGLWFVGLEEADDFPFDWSQEKIVKWYEERGNREFLPCDDSKDYSTLGREGAAIRAYSCKIANAVSRKPTNTWEDYRDRRLWKSGCQLFQANLYALGKPRSGSWIDKFEERYGYGSSPEDRKAYKKRVRETRFPALRELWRRSTPQAVICFARWSDCREIFNVSSPADVIADGDIHVHAPEKIILTPFFARGMSDAKAEQVWTRLHQWGVSIA